MIFHDIFAVHIDSWRVWTTWGHSKGYLAQNRKGCSQIFVKKSARGGVLLYCDDTCAFKLRYFNRYFIYCVFMLIYFVHLAIFRKLQIVLVLNVKNKNATNLFNFKFMQTIKRYQKNSLISVHTWITFHMIWNNRVLLHVHEETVLHIWLKMPLNSMF